MITLDQAIELMESQVGELGGVIGVVLYADDILHYLRAFRDAKDALEAEKDRYAEAVRNCEKAENKYRKMEDELNDIRRKHIEQMKAENPPLSWDELRQMEGKPVWMEDNTGYKQYQGWAIILKFLYSDTFIRYVCNDYSETCVDVEDLGKTWQAYRKERNAR